VASKKKTSRTTKKVAAAPADPVKALFERTKAEATTKTTRRQRKLDDRAMVRITVWLDEHVVKGLKLSAVENDTTVQAILEEIVGGWVQKQRR
jgi:DNA-binding GntR family transcriptional regulator